MRNLYLPLVLVIAFGCGSPNDGAMPSSGTYSAPNGLFTCPYPDLAPDAQMHEQFNDTGFGVAFWDDFGQIRRLEGFKLPEPLPVEFETREELLVDILQKWSMQAFLQASPESSVEVTEYAASPHGGLLFATISLPGGSMTAVSVNGAPPERRDVIRGLTLFVEDGWLFQVSAQLLQPLEPRTRELETEMLREVVTNLAGSLDV